MYFVWQRDLTLEDDFALFDDEPQEFRTKTWISGERLVDPPVFELRRAAKSPEKLSDQLLTTFQMQVFSPRLVSLLADVGVRALEYFPIKLVVNRKKPAEDSYRVANIVETISCLDLEHSDFTRSQGTGNIVRVSRFRLLPEKLTAEPLFFRLAELKFHVLVHQRVKDVCEKAGITGVKFVLPEECV